MTTNDPNDPPYSVQAAGLLLPGMSLNATIFPNLSIPTVSPDLCAIGVGETGTASEPAGDGFGAYTRALEDELGSAHCWRRPAKRIVVGHSFGGMLALHWLLNSEARALADVDGLVLIATTAGPMYRQAKMRLVKLGDLEWRIGLERLIPLWNHASVTRTVKRIVCRGRLDAQAVDFRAASVNSDVQLDLAGWRNTDWRAMRAFRTAMNGYDVRERLSEIDVPAIILHGTDDSLFETANAHLLADHIPKAELRQVKGAGHALPLTHGKEVVQAVGTLLGDYSS